MYTFVDVKAIAKGKVVNKLRALHSGGWIVVFSKQDIQDTTDIVLEEYYNHYDLSLNNLDVITDRVVNEKIFNVTENIAIVNSLTVK